MTVNYNTININLTSVSTDDPESQVPCGTCTLCCQLLTPMLTIEEINSGLYPISLINPTPEQLAQDPNLGPIVSMYKNPNGGCSQFIDGKCSIYEYRPRSCRQFDCRKGHHPITNAIAKEKFGTSDVT